jgi:hypothetical protein
VNATDYAESAPAAHQGQRAAGPDLPITIISARPGMVRLARCGQALAPIAISSVCPCGARCSSRTYKQINFGPAWHVPCDRLVDQRTHFQPIVFAGRMPGLSHRRGRTPASCFTTLAAGHAYRAATPYFATAVRDVAMNFCGQRNIVHPPTRPTSITFHHRLGHSRFSILSLSTFIAFGHSAVCVFASPSFHRPYCPRADVRWSYDWMRLAAPLLSCFIVVGLVQWPFGILRLCDYAEVPRLWRMFFYRSPCKLVAGTVTPERSIRSTSGPRKTIFKISSG